MVSIIVIGAGVAGLSAASHLQQNGLKNVKVLEARNRIGGRLYVHTYDGMKKIQLGAECIHGVCKSNAMFALAENHGLLSLDMERYSKGDLHPESFDLEHFYGDDGRRIQVAAVKVAGEMHQQICFKAQQRYVQLSNSEAMMKEFSSVGDFFDSQAQLEMQKLDSDGEDFKDDVRAALYGCFQNILVGYIGASKCRLEMFGSARELPGGDLELPVSITDALKDDVENYEDVVLLNKKVTCIDWSDSMVKVKVNGAEEFAADFVISTLPSGVMKKYHKDLFVPALPDDKSEVLGQIESGANAKIFVDWKTPWRQANHHPIHFAWSKGEMDSVDLPQEWTKGVFEMLAIDPKGSLMVLWVAGKCAEVVDTLTDDQVKTDVGNLLRRFLKDSSIPDPDRIIRNCWSTDEFTLGSYSSPGMNANETTFLVNGRPLPNEGTPRLLFAGEATHPKLWSFLHGARESGIREAQRIIDIQTRMPK